MSRTVFKKVEDAYIAVVMELKKEEKKKEYKDVSKIEQLRKQKDMIQEVSDYIKSFSWLKHEETIKRIKFFLKNKYNYQEFCNQFEITYEAAKVCVSYANQKCIEKIGRNTIDLIVEGRLDEARAEFYFRTGQLKIRNFIVDSALIEVPEPAYITLDIEECKKELSFLRLYSQALLDSRVELLDKDKLAYIRYILEGDNPKLSEQRLLLMKMLSCQIKVEDFINEVKEINVY